MKLLECKMKIGIGGKDKRIERVSEKKIRVLVEVDNLQLGFIQGRGTIDALFIVKRMQEEYKKIKIVHMFHKFREGL